MSETTAMHSSEPCQGSVCPWWLGYFLANPLRRVFGAPEELVQPYSRAGQTVLEVGPGMGFYTLALAQTVGRTGRVVAVELQEKMRRELSRRVATAGLADRVEIRACQPDDLDIAHLQGTVDVILAVNVVHEAGNPRGMLEQMIRTLRPGGTLILCEPGGGHCPASLFGHEIQWCLEGGLEQAQEVEEGWFRKKAILRKPCSGDAST